MAKKAKECFVYLDFAIQINVSKNQVEKFLSDIERGEVSLLVQMPYGDEMYSPFSIYPDMFKSGGMTLAHVEGDTFNLACKGVVVRKFDIPFENDLLACLEQSDLVVMPSSVTNSDSEGADLDQQDKKLHGRCSLT